MVNGDVLGQQSTIVDYEANGALFTWVDFEPEETGADGTPVNFEILGNSPARLTNRFGNTTMGVFKTGDKGGMVFNAATVDWADGLFSDGLWPTTTSAISDPLVSKMPLNILSMFDPADSASCANNNSVIDVDNDGVNDVCDNCVAIQNPNQTDTDNDGTGNACDMDDDNDGALDVNDSFQLDPAETLDFDGDSIGNNADNCTIDINSNQIDLDGDGV